MQAASSCQHVPVLAREVAALIRPTVAGAVLDATFGAGGHARCILERAPKVTVVAADRDPTAHVRAEMFATEQRGLGRNVVPLRMRFSEIRRQLAASGITQLAGALFDLGVSSMQLDEDQRGFAFKSDGPLDMRMDQSDVNSPTAADIVNNVSEHELAKIIRTLGEEPRAGRIAREIVAVRARAGPIVTTRQLAQIVRSVVPPKVGRDGTERDAATLTFQALRMHVNDELEELRSGLSDVETLLQAGGFLIVISYHSLEDRLVKQFMFGDGGIDGIDGGRRALPFRPLTESRKVVVPSADEIAKNPRARSAKLRAVVRTSSIVRDRRYFHVY